MRAPRIAGGDAERVERPDRDAGEAKRDAKRKKGAIRFISRHTGIAKGTRPIAVLRSIIDTARNWISWGMSSRRHRIRAQSIRRVSEPFKLDQSILRLVLPLFDDFKP